MNTLTKQRSRKSLILVTLVLIVLFAWTRGTFDHLLVNAGLNYNDCARNGFGATFCGDELKTYQARLDKAGIK